MEVTLGRLCLLGRERVRRRRILKLGSKEVKRFLRTQISDGGLYDQLHWVQSLDNDRTSSFNYIS